ncbi:MAG: PHP domain-containing protein, partial [Candidatus Humimicrobiaceae bacterium]
MTLFSHLHVHSEYSIMESTVKIDDLLEAASRANMESVALTDKYMMSGAIEFYRKAASRNIKPIIGCE